MFQFFESIKIENAIPQNIFFHQKRINETFNQFFPNEKPFELIKVFKDFTFDFNEIYKFRISYSSKIEQIEYSKYIPKIHTHFKLLEVDKLFYSNKFENRDFINELKSKTKDEIIMFKNGEILDSAYANIIFKKEEKWFVPKSYLLNGTQRQFLIQEKKVLEREIRIENLVEFSHFKLINAMLNLEESTMYEIEMINY